VIFAAAILVVSLAVSGYAYWVLLPPQGGPRVTITSPPVEFSMELDKTEYQYGENITIIFSLENISNQTITISKSYWWPIDPVHGILSTEAEGANISAPQIPHLLSALFHFGLGITDQNGTKVFEQYRGLSPATYNFSIEPSGHVKQTLVLGPDWDTLPKGTYQIRGIQYCGILGYWWGKLETPTITFVIN
jgi:hypothetical protein